MNRNRLLLPAVLVLLALVLASCNLPGLNAPPTPFPSSQQQNAAYTAAAETIIAQLTQISQPTSLPTGSAPGIQVGTATLPAPSVATATLGETAPASGESEATATPEASATPEPSSTPEPPIATFPAGDPRAGLGDPTWRETFKNGNHWYLYVDNNSAFEIKNRTLLMTSYTTGTRNAWMLSDQEPLNYYLEITAQPQDCTGLDRYGVIVRSDGTTGYLFGITCDGRYSFRLWNGKKMTKLVEWTAASSILAGSNQTNRVGIRVEGSKFSLYANGVLLNEVNDASYPDGGFGVHIGADTTPGLEVLVSEVDYWELP